MSLCQFWDCYSVKPGSQYVARTCDAMRHYCFDRFWLSRCHFCCITIVVQKLWCDQKWHCAWQSKLVTAVKLHHIAGPDSIYCEPTFSCHTAIKFSLTTCSGEHGRRRCLGLWCTEGSEGSSQKEYISEGDQYWILYLYSTTAIHKGPAQSKVMRT